jgi:transposase
MGDPLARDDAYWQVVLVQTERAGSVVLHLAPARAAVPCPACGQLSGRRHSWYQRQPLDLPWRGVTVRLRIRTRRFFCDALACARKIFAERFPARLPAFARRTDGVTTLLVGIVQRTSAEAGARLARAAGVPVSPDTLLRLLRRLGQGPVPTPRVLGVDDFSLRRGRTFATLLVDLETHAPIDVLPDREAATVAAWLQAHPGVEVLSRDRAEAYAEAGRRGAPTAIQVADRFHLVQNVTAALAELLRGRRRQLDVVRTVEAAELEAAGPTPPPEATRPLTSTQQAERAARARRVARWEEVRRRHAAGESLRQIARETGHHRRTVRQLVATPEPPRNQARRPAALTGLRSPTLAPFVPYLEGRWRAGCTNISQLCREIEAQGYRASRSLVRQALLAWRGPRPSRAERQRQRRQTRRRSVRWLCLCPPDALEPEEQLALQHLLAGDVEVARGHALVQRFRQIVRERDRGGLDAFLADAAASGLPPFESFARGIATDRAAVDAALTLPWSNGLVEGHVHRVKLLKRLGYGRAALPTLRARILAAA